MNSIQEQIGEEEEEEREIRGRGSSKAGNTHCSVWPRQYTLPMHHPGVELALVDVAVQEGGLAATLVGTIVHLRAVARAQAATQQEGNEVMDHGLWRCGWKTRERRANNLARR